MNGVAIKQSGAYTGAASASFKIKRKHVGGFDSARGRKSGTDRFSPAGKPGEVVKPNASRDDDVRKVLERAIKFYRRAEIGCSQL